MLELLGLLLGQELGNTPTVERRGQSSLPWPSGCGTLQLKPDQDTLRPGKRDANSLPACMRNSSRRCPVLLSARAQLTLSHREQTPASKPDHRKQAQQDTLLCIEDWEGSNFFGPPGEKPKVPAGRERSPRKLVTPQPTLCPQPSPSLSSCSPCDKWVQTKWVPSTRHPEKKSHCLKSSLHSPNPLAADLPMGTPGWRQVRPCQAGNWLNLGSVELHPSPCLPKA